MTNSSVFTTKQNIDTDFYKAHHCTPPSGLLESQKGAFYFAKDLNGRFVYVNDKVLSFFNLQSADEIIGKTDFDLCSQEMAEACRKDDQLVIAEKTFISNKIELLDNGEGAKEWFSTTKGPLFNSHGQIVGIEGIAFSTTTISSSQEQKNELKSCIEFFQKNYMKPILMKDMAAQFHMSISTFEKKFKSLFNISPKQYLKRFRIQKACEMLRLNHSVKEVTYSTGFCDQSYFTKEFRLTMKMTPNAYKKSFQNSTKTKEQLGFTDPLSKIEQESPAFSSNQQLVS